MSVVEWLLLLNLLVQLGRLALDFVKVRQGERK